MYNKGTIITGLVIFVVLFTSPFVLGLVTSGPPPEPELTAKAKQAKQCVEVKEFMVESHMQLLDDWRNEAVREGKRTYVATDGKPYTVSLQNTCMECHSNKSKFCDQCHNYAGVDPYCWQCHIAPKEKS
ncbi:MAG: sulfate reduction electron transfer complex DsrMKJOP subunit DsrJ [Deltaproteobacteria bacterium]|nr:MAG: sulfate reduction electron transfer complex DsrMKJOP subunit DsrJ [Deltaproteobacteria bacterium]